MANRSSIITLWPYKELNPNRAKHWALLMKATKQARADAHTNCLEQRPDFSWIKPETNLVSLRIFHPPTKPYTWDTDNLGRMMKPYQDGIFDYINRNDPDNPIADDQQVIITLNLIARNYTNEYGEVETILMEHTLSVWINTIPTLVFLYWKPI